MWDVLLDALIDTLKLAPIIVLTYFLIELIETRFAGKVAKNRALFSDAAPAVGAVVGIVPQCGFSVVSANLYSAGKISLGTLLAVFIATSDEAVPVLLADYRNAYKLLPLLAVKFALALVVGYAVHFLFPRGFKFGKKALSSEHSDGSDATEKAQSEDIKSPETSADGRAPEMTAVCEETCETAHTEEREEHEEHEGHEEQEERGSVHGCHGHSVTGKPSVKEAVLHPLLHSLTVLGFILAVNVILGYVVYFVGEDRLTDFLGKTAIIQPFVATLIGLIPNCAASVVISELYAMGGLTLGSAVAGLSAGAGIGYAVLFKENKSLKENLAIVGFMYVVCTAAGLVTDVVAALF